MDGRVVGVNDLEPGMVLAQDVKTSNGRLLVAAGNEVMDRHKAIFKQWQVTDVLVVGKDGSHRPHRPLPKSVVLKAHKMNRVRFCRCDLSKDGEDNFAVRAIYKRSTLRIAKLILRNEVSKIVPNLSEISRVDATKITLSPPKSSMLVDGNVKLGTMPDIFTQINDAVNRPNTSADDIANIVRKDVALSARLLKIVNSPFFALQSKIDTIGRAVTVIGTHQLAQLAIGISVVNMFSHIPKGIGVDMYRFWQHSLAVGIASKILATHAGMPRAAERLFICGLLHDLGRIVMYTYAPKEMLFCLHRAAKSRVSLRFVESKVFGYNHCHVAARLFRKWRLPDSIEMCAKWHDSPDGAKYNKDVCVVHVANAFVNAMGYGTSGEIFIPGIDGKAWDMLGVNEAVMDSLAETLDYQMEDIMKMMVVNDD